LSFSLVAMTTGTHYPLIRCRTLDDIVFALGGQQAVAELVGSGPSAVCNWRATNGRIPAQHYALVALALHDKGFYAPWSLFSFKGIADDNSVIPREAAE
jgi:hypothetical protein